MRSARRAPAHRNACSIPETAHPTANAGFRMRRLSNGNRILVGRRSLSCGSCRDLLTILFRGSILTPLFRLSHPTDARRRVGQAIHHGGRWTDEGVSIRAVECATRDERTAHRNACSIPETAHPTANAGFRMRRLSNGNRILVGRRSLSRGSCRDLLTILFRGSILTPLFRLSHPTDARRRVGQAIHHGGRWTDEGGSIRAVECATRDKRRPTEMRAPSRRPRIASQAKSIQILDFFELAIGVFPIFRIARIRQILPILAVLNGYLKVALISCSLKKTSPNA